MKGDENSFLLRASGGLRLEFFFEPTYRNVLLFGDISPIGRFEDRIRTKLELGSWQLCCERISGDVKLALFFD